MKLKDVKVGGEYLLNQTQNWNTSLFSSSDHWGNRRVRVLDTTHQNWIYNAKTGQHEKGSVYSSRARNGILVQILDPETGADVENGCTVATLASLRGPWAETSAQVVKNRAAREEYTAQKKVEKTARQDVMSDALKLAEKLGVRAKSVKWDHDGDVEMTPAQLIEILTALESAGWKSPGGK